MAQTINVRIVDMHGLIETVEVDTTTTGSSLCHLICQKLRLNPNLLKYFTVFMIVSSLNESGTGMMHCLRTVSNSECVLSICERVIAKQSAKCSKALPSTASRASCRWYFKDTRTAPIDTGDFADLSGDSDSDDESPLPSGDYVYLCKAERKGYLYRKSSRDPNLWRKRLCLLTDKLWCINDRKLPMRGMSLVLNNSLTADTSSQPMNIPFPVTVVGGSRVHYFKANSASDAVSWTNEIYKSGFHAEDNGLIHLAEVIIGDEEFIVANRKQEICSSVIDSDLFNTVLSAHDFYAYHDSNRDLPVGWEASDIHRQFMSSDEDDSGNDEASENDGDDHDSDDDEVFKTPQKSAGLKGSFENLVALGTEPARNNRSTRTGNSGGAASSQSALQIQTTRQSRNTGFSSPYSSNSIAGYVHLSTTLRTCFPIQRLGVHYHRRTALSMRLRSTQRNKVAFNSLTHYLHKQHKFIADGINFLSEVSKFRNLFRYDANVPIKQLWVCAIQIFSKYLTPVISQKATRSFDRESLKRSQKHSKKQSRQIGEASSESSERGSISSVIKNIMRVTSPVASPALIPTSADRSSYQSAKLEVDPEILEEGIWELSHEAIVKVHDILFNNIRPCAISTPVKEGNNSTNVDSRSKSLSRTESTRSVSNTPTGSRSRSNTTSWIWGSRSVSTPANESAGLDSPPSADQDQDDTTLDPTITELYINSYLSFKPNTTLDPGRTTGQYEFIDNSIGPDINLFDDIVKDMRFLIDRSNHLVKILWTQTQERLEYKLAKSVMKRETIKSQPR